MRRFLQFYGNGTDFILHVSPGWLAESLFDSAQEFLDTMGGEIGTFECSRYALTCEKQAFSISEEILPNGLLASVVTGPGRNNQVIQYYSIRDKNDEHISVSMLFIYTDSTKWHNAKQHILSSLHPAIQ